MAFSGEEEGRAGGLSTGDGLRRRMSGSLLNSGSLLKQKSPLANDPTVSKDPTVCWFSVWMECLL